MRAITVRQPWAWAILYLGKGVENRGRAHPWTSAVGERVAIHAATGPAEDSDEFDDAWTDVALIHLETNTPFDFGWEEREYLGVRGAVLGTAVFSDVHPAGSCGGACSPWAQPDQWHLVLTDVRPIPRPVPARGMLGLWTLTPEQQTAVERQATS